MNSIKPETLSFLKDLKKNNNRIWFAEHKPQFQKLNEEFIEFANVLLAELKNHDNIETPSGKKSVYRIYRDIRFSKDKTPYKKHFSGSFKRATKELRGGYYFHIEPGNSFIAGGFWGPSPKDLLRVRQEIDIDASELIQIISSIGFKSTFGSLQGEKIKTTPRGFDKNHCDIELLRYKQFLVLKKFTDKEVMEKDFYIAALHTFLKMRPFLNYMSSVLITDANGTFISI